MTKQEEKNKIYEGMVGKAKFERKMIDPCVYYDAFGLCGISECLYCENCCYKITLENEEAISNIDKDLSQIENKDSLNYDLEIIFYDYIPDIDDLFGYLFDDESHYKIVRTEDNVVMVNHDPKVELVSIFKNKKQERRFAKAARRNMKNRATLTWDDEEPKIYYKK